MGITDFSISLLNKVISQYHPKTVCELGDQNLYTADNRYGKYADIYYSEKGIEKYVCIDLNGGNGAVVADMARPLVGVIEGYDLVTDFGFSEHLEKNSRFNIEAYYTCWLNKHNLLKVGGIMVNENPMTGSWGGHGYNYLDTNFYFELCKMAEYELLETGTQAAMGNVIDGWNIFGIIRKTGDQFLSLNQFSSLPIKQA